MTTINIYQAANEDQFVMNMMGSLTGIYANVQEMDKVITCQLPHVNDEQRLLEGIFLKGNDGTLANNLHYSLSVGDVVSIGDHTYRCTPCGWDLE